MSHITSELYTTVAPSKSLVEPAQYLTVRVATSPVHELQHGAMLFREHGVRRLPRWQPMAAMLWITGDSEYELRTPLPAAPTRPLTACHA